MENGTTVEAVAKQEVAVPITQAPPSLPDRIDRVDQLEIENIYLKLKNLELQIQDLDAKKKDAGLQMIQLQSDMRKKSQELSVKYGIPIGPGTSALRADGTIVRPLAAPIAKLGDRVTVMTAQGPAELPGGIPLGVIGDTHKVTA
jgi:hypothetical protein